MQPRDPLRIGNASGFYGDRFAAVREMLTGGPLDVLTGDYLAELTMLILGRDRMKDPSLGYAKTFLRQMEDCLGLAAERDVRIVVNAGGLNPAGCADAVRALASRLGVETTVAHVAGHVLECGTQATGGNFSFFDEVPGMEHAGFPLAEVAADGSCVVTKHPGTG